MHLKPGSHLVEFWDLDFYHYMLIHIVTKIEKALEIEEVFKKFRVKGGTEKVSNSLVWRAGITWDNILHQYMEMKSLLNVQFATTVLH